MKTYSFLIGTAKSTTELLANFGVSEVLLFRFRQAFQVYVLFLTNNRVLCSEKNFLLLFSLLKNFWQL